MSAPHAPRPLFEVAIPAPADAVLAPQELSEAYFAALHERTSWDLLGVGSRLRSHLILNDLADRASGGALEWAALRELLSSTTAGALDARIVDPQAAIGALLLFCILEPDPSHFKETSAALQVLGAPEHLTRKSAARPLQLAAQIAAMSNDVALFERLAKISALPDSVAWAGRCDFLLEAALSENTDLAALLHSWWPRFNEPFVQAGLEPFVLQPDLLSDSQPLFPAIEVPTGLTATVKPRKQPLISVIVPTYSPDAGFLNTIASMTRQSWQNIEILIVDDCSPRGQEYIREAAASDSRVQVIAQPQNGGAYAARNAGLARARGEFVTFQDADDLSHPRRLERQVAPLLARPEIIATTSRAQRLLSDGRLTYFGYRPHRENASSLMFRRRRVLDALGQYDGVRKGADSEFTERLLAAFGAKSLFKLKEPLSLVQLTLGSLSRSDFRPGWMSGDRLAYSRQFRAAHQRIARAEAPDWRLSDERPSVCSTTARMRGVAPRTRLETAILSDWQLGVEGPLGGIEKARLYAGGARSPFGLLNGLRPRFSRMTRDMISEDLAVAVEREECAWMSWGDDLSIGTLIIDNPEFLVHLPASKDISLRVERVEIVLDETVRRIEQAATAPLDWCEQRVSEVFGVAPSWATHSSACAALLARTGRSFRRIPAPRQQLPLLKGRLSIGVPLPSPSDRVMWSPKRIRDLLPEDSLADIVYYDAGGFFTGKSSHQRLGHTVWSGTEHSREEFLQHVDIVAPDLLGESLLASPAWVRDCAQRSIPVALPADDTTEHDAAVMRYPVRGSRDFFSAIALRPGILRSVPRNGVESMQAAIRPDAPQILCGTRTRFLILSDGDDLDLCDVTRNSIELTSDAPQSAEIRVVRAKHFADLTPADLVDGLAPSDFVCLVRPGVRFEFQSFKGLEDDIESDIYVCAEAGYPYRLNRGVPAKTRIPVQQSTPVWLGDTPTLIRATTLFAAASRYPSLPILDFAFLAAVTISPAFRRLGRVYSPAPADDRYTADPTALVKNWMTLLSGSEPLPHVFRYHRRVLRHLCKQEGLDEFALRLTPEEEQRYMALIGKAAK